MKNLESQTIALAAIYQSCHVIKEIAWYGRFSGEDLDILINSLFIINPSIIQDVYENTEGLTTGLKFLKEQLTNTPKDQLMAADHSMEAKQYFSALITLSKELEKDTTIKAQVQEELLSFKGLIAKDKLNLNDKTIKLSEIYVRTLSKIRPRIIVAGNNEYLKNSSVTSKIRAALFVGLRSVFLWRQFGGSKIKNFFNQSRIINEINRLLAS